MTKDPKITIRVEGAGLPAGGSPGQVLSRTGSGYEWTNPLIAERIATDATLTRADVAADAKAAGDALARKLDAVMAAEYAGRLICIAENGALVPLALGPGLEIRSGMLCAVSGASVYSVLIDESGDATIDGLEIAVDGAGDAAFSGGTLAVDDSGDATIV